MSNWFSEKPVGQSQAGNAAAAEISRLTAELAETHQLTLDQCDYAKTLNDERDCLLEICRQAHDRPLRGGSDAELLELLAEAWAKP